MITVFFKRIDNMSSQEQKDIISSLSKPAKERLDKKRNEALHLASLCALSLLNDSQRACLSYTKSGRPFFEGIDADISISHSRTHAAVAISSSMDESVGIDIEYNVEDSSHLIKIFASRFTSNEIKERKDDQSIVELWTKKEALLKYLKNEDLPLLAVDSSDPSLHGASFTLKKTDELILTVCAPEDSSVTIIEK